MESELERIWDGILSREPERIRATYRGLSLPDRRTVMTHLHRMADEDGWHPEQQLSAKIALDALQARRRKHD
jgi:hypothetical protein